MQGARGSLCAQWLAAEQAMLLPVPYFHVVFTLPHVLNALVRANRRLLFVGEGVVRFSYRDYGNHDRIKEMLLPATEFLRFLLHLVPRGFMRIRHYGITANFHRRRKLQRCRELFGSAPAAATATDPATHTAAADTATRSAESSRQVCPTCGAPLRIIDIIPAARGDRELAAVVPPDTS